MVGLWVGGGVMADAPRVFRPNSWAQERCLTSEARELLFSSRVFAGKTWAGCLKAYAYAATNRMAEVALCRKERASMNATTLRVFRNEIVSAEHWQWGWREQASELRFPNGAVIRVFGLDDPGRALGARFGLVVIDQAEQISESDFELINTRVGQPDVPYQQILLICNPDSPDHWIYKRYRPDSGIGTRVDAKGIEFAEVILSSPEDNMEYATQTYRESLDRMSGTWRMRYRLGQWAGFEGAVYGDAWDAARHVVERPAAWAEWGGYPPPGWQRIRSVDFGFYPDPFVCQWFAIDHDGRYWRYREIYMTKRLVEDHARDIVELESREREVLTALAAERGLGRVDVGAVESWADHDREDRETLMRHGVWSDPAQKDVLAGIQTLTSVLRGDERGPRLLLVRGALVEQDEVLRESGRPTCTEEEFPLYRWRSVRQTDATRATALEMPVDRDNHGLDALRYAIYSREAIPMARVVA